MQVGLFGIFDAHNGDAVAKHLQESLFNNIMNEGGAWADPAGATRDGYLLTDRNILESTIEKGGSTAVTAMIWERGRRLIVANVGDSKAVMSKNGKAVQISVDHDPGRPTERADVEARGGHVTHLPGDISSDNERLRFDLHKDSWEIDNSYVYCDISWMVRFHVVDSSLRASQLLTESCLGIYFLLEILDWSDGH